MIWWTGLAPWEFGLPFSSSLISTFLVLFIVLLSAASQCRPVPPLPSSRPGGQPLSPLHTVGAPQRFLQLVAASLSPLKIFRPFPASCPPPPHASLLPVPTPTCRAIRAQREHLKKAALPIEVLERERERPPFTPPDTPESEREPLGARDTLSAAHLQGYLAHKKVLPTRTLQEAYA